MWYLGCRMNSVPNMSNIDHTTDELLMIYYRLLFIGARIPAYGRCFQRGMDRSTSNFVGTLSVPLLRTKFKKE